MKHKKQLNWKITRKRLKTSPWWKTMKKIQLGRKNKKITMLRVSVKKRDDDSVENNNGKDVKVDPDHIAMKLEENKTGEASKNEEEFLFWEEDSKEEEEWKEPEENCTYGKGKPQ